MSVRVESTGIAGLVVVHVTAQADTRGSFRELFRADHFAAAGLPDIVAQINLSRSAKGVVRGLHYQSSPPMGKAMRVVRGRALLVAVDVRHNSPTCGQSWAREMIATDECWVVAPAGFARGLQALEDDTDVEYLCTAPYNAAGEGGIRWDDPALGISWPLPARAVSEKDRAAPLLADWLAGPHGKTFSV